MQSEGNSFLNICEYQYQSVPIIYHYFRYICSDVDNFEHFYFSSFLRDILLFCANCACSLNCIVSVSLFMSVQIATYIGCVIQCKIKILTLFTLFEIFSHATVVCKSFNCGQIFFFFFFFGRPIKFWEYLTSLVVIVMWHENNAFSMSVTFVFT